MHSILFASKWPSWPYRGGGSLGLLTINYTKGCSRNYPQGGGGQQAIFFVLWGGC